MVIDPVCLKHIDESMSMEKVAFRGQTYYFDSDRCRQVFEEDPEEYAGNVAEVVYGDHGHRFSKEQW